jgi:hypothetical protein
MGKGEDLNERVWTLFERAGFSTKPNSTSKTEPKIRLPGGVAKPVDLVAIDAKLGVTLLGSNKSGPKIEDFYDHVAGLCDLRDAAGANGALLVASAKEFNSQELRFLRKKNVHLWGARELSYFEALTTAIGPYAKYEFIHWFNVPTTEQTEKITIPALMVRQPAWVASSKVGLYMFSLPADTLLKICAVLRKARSNAFTYQRILSKKRLPKIGEFLDGAKALLPTNLVVHLNDSVTISS